MGSNITSIITTLVLVSNIIFVLGLALLFAEPKFKKWVYEFVDKNILKILFTLSLAAVVGSLTYSNIIGFAPCELCWVQRIFMYPQVILTFVAMLKKDKNIVNYLLPLSILGIITAFYHSMGQWGFGNSLGGCLSVGAECGKVYVRGFNYITIPFMSFTIFAYLIAVTLVYYKAQNARK